MSQTYYS